MGLSIRPVQTRSLMTEGMDAAAIAEQYYEPPLINIIPYACHACPTNQYRVTENCQNCLAAFLPAGLSQGRSLLRQRQEPH